MTESNNTLDLMTVKRAVYSWSIRFKSAGYGGEQLNMLSKEYFEDLLSEGVTLKQFEAAAMMVRKRCRFFPTMADILAAVCEHRSKPSSTNPGCCLQIADSSCVKVWTKEEMQRNLARIGIIASAIARQISYEEAEREVLRMGHIDHFSVDEELKGSVSVSHE